VNIEQVAHDKFKRDGNNLIYTHKIQLVDALSPKPFHVTTLDSRTLALVPPQVVSPQTKIEIENEGMPGCFTGDIFQDTKAKLGPVQS
jgi:DnaJ family protein B protein 4